MLLASNGRGRSRSLRASSPSRARVQGVAKNSRLGVDVSTAVAPTSDGARGVGRGVLRGLIRGVKSTPSALGARLAVINGFVSLGAVAIEGAAIQDTPISRRAIAAQVRDQREAARINFILSLRSIQEDIYRVRPTTSRCFRWAWAHSPNCQ